MHQPLGARAGFINAVLGRARLSGMPQVKSFQPQPSRSPQQASLFRSRNKHTFLFSTATRGVIIWAISVTGSLLFSQTSTSSQPTLTCTKRRIQHEVFN